MSPSKLDEFVSYVRATSPFFSQFWRGIVIPKGVEDATILKTLPVVDHTAYWKENTCVGSGVLTAQQHDGIIFKTGGTTSSPKVSFYSRGEVDEVAHDLATCLLRCGVGRGDRVGNLFYAGDLYGSFLLHILSVHFFSSGHNAAGAVQVPIAGHVGIPSMVGYVTEVEVTVILATVTTMCKMAEHLLEENPDGTRKRPEKAAVAARHIRLLLFSGEALYNDQVKVLAAAFPNAKVRSLVYGTMDCGVVGLPPSHPPSAGPPTTTDTPQSTSPSRTPPPDRPGIIQHDPRLHQVNTGSNMIVEIVTDDGSPTTNPGVPGSIIVTNLNRRLMPVVRYPTGDLGEWVDASAGLFRILGRDRTAIRLGPVSLDFVHIREVVSTALGRDRAAAGIQVRVGRRDAKDLLTIRVVYRPRTDTEADELRAAVAAVLDEARPMFRDHVRDGLINPVEVEFVSADDLVMSERTGKTVDVLDVRSTT